MKKSGHFPLFCVRNNDARTKSMITEKQNERHIKSKSEKSTERVARDSDNEMSNKCLSLVKSSEI